MPEIMINWDLVVKNDGLYDVTQALHVPVHLRTEALVVLHASRLHYERRFGTSLSTAVTTAVALAEVNSIEAVNALLEVKPKSVLGETAESDPSRVMMAPSIRVGARCTRLIFRSGEPIILLHPFEDVERLFTQYRIYAAKAKG